VSNMNHEPLQLRIDLQNLNSRANQGRTAYMTVNA
jgi:hypothetical protein